MNKATENRLENTLQQSLKNPVSRVYQPTYTGFLSEQMSPQKGAVDNLRECVNQTTRIPGGVGWGVERQHLKDQVRMLTDDTRVDSFPI